MPPSFVESICFDLHQNQIGFGARPQNFHASTELHLTQQTQIFCRHTIPPQLIRLHLPTTTAIGGVSFGCKYFKLKLCMRLTTNNSLRHLRAYLVHISVFHHNLCKHLQVLLWRRHDIFDTIWFGLYSQLCLISHRLIFTTPIHHCDLECFFAITMHSERSSFFYFKLNRINEVPGALLLQRESRRAATDHEWFHSKLYMQCSPHCRLLLLPDLELGLT